MRFKKTFRISRATFRYILDRIEPILARQTLPYAYIDWEEETIIIRLQKWWEERGVSTVSCIVEEVSQVLVNHLWNNCVSVHMPGENSW